MESHAVLDRQLPPSSQEISTLDHNLERTGTDGRHSLNASISTPIPVTAFQVDKRLPPSITEMHTSDHDLEKSGCTDSEKASISIPVTETETLDIEHVPVQNDPRKWSSFRKVSFWPKFPSWLLHFFYYPFSYIACHPGINLFCNFDRWTWMQYTEPWVYMAYIHWLLPNYYSLIPSCGCRDGNRITSNPFAIQPEYFDLYPPPRLDAALLECIKRG